MTELDLIGTFWAGSQWHGRHRPLHEVVDVRPWWNGSRWTQMVYTRRLDDGNHSDHPQGTVRRVAWVGVFKDVYTQITEDEAHDEAAFGRQVWA